MTRTTAEQRAEVARLLTARASDDLWWPEYEAAGDRLLALLPALLADVEALAAREAEDDAGDPPVVTPAVPSREVTVRIVGRERVVSAKYPEELVDGR